MRLEYRYTTFWWIYPAWFRDWLVYERNENETSFDLGIVEWFVYD
jgi:hypothetical protein